MKQADQADADVHRCLSRNLIWKNSRSTARSAIHSCNKGLYRKGIFNLLFGLWQNLCGYEDKPISASGTATRLSLTITAKWPSNNHSVITYSKTCNPFGNINRFSVKSRTQVRIARFKRICVDIDFALIATDRTGGLCHAQYQAFVCFQGNRRI